MRTAEALQSRTFAAKLVKADSIISSAQLTAPESASTPIYYPPTHTHTQTIFSAPSLLFPWE